MIQHWFWLGLTVAVLGWYSSITVYVSIKGVKDIRDMLKKLSSGDAVHAKNNSNITNQEGL